MLKQSSTAQPLLFLLVQSSDHITGLTGASPTVKLGKSGGIGASPSGTVTEIDSTNLPGWYKVAGNATDTNTLGPLVLHASAASGDPVDVEYEVVAYDPQDGTRLGITALPNANAAASGGLFTQGTGSGQINQDANGRIDINIKAIAADTSAPGNLANTFNGTGYSNALAPAQQQQVANIAVTSAALNTVATGNTITTGTETGTYANTATADGVYDVITAASGTIDLYYSFSVGSSGGIATSVSFLGYLSGAANTIKVFAYNWGGSSWDQVGTIIGMSGVVNQSADYDLTSANTGIGGNLGLVRIRFQNTGMTLGVLNTDRLLVGYAVVQTFPTNFSTLVIDGSGRVDVGKVTGTAQTARDIGASVLLSSGTGTGQVTLSSGVASANAVQINSDATAAVNQQIAARAIVRGTVGTGSTTTSIVTSALSPSAVDASQFIGRVVIFDYNTTTTGLRGQPAVISANTSGGTLTVATMTESPVSGDTFGIY